ncbi:MAG: PIG-L family deacetylase [Holophagales bacterium]|nr:PIG-L family deacetylase [Holophagales bacterium]
MSTSPVFEECLLVPYGAAEVRPETLLVLAPHPDDEVFGCGGLTALVSAAGGRVVPVLLTDGGAGDFSGSSEAGAYVARRLAESTRAAGILGTEPPRPLGFPDRSLPERGEELVAALVALFAEVRPDAVLVPSPAETHPDHRAAARAAHQAFLCAWPDAPARLVFYEVSAPLAPNRLVAVDAAVARKSAAIAAFESQLTERPFDELVEGISAYRAMTLPAGISRAEAFLELTREEAVALPWAALCRRAGPERPDAFVPAVRISVVIPTFDRLADLTRTLAALEEERAGLSFGVEIVVVDDGSRDGTGRYLPEWAGRTSRAKVLSQANAGPARARNRGAAAATGEIVLFLGDDTVPEPQFLSVHERAHRLGGPGPVAVLGYTTWDEERMRVTPFLTHLNENGTQFGYAIIPDPDDVPFNFFYTSNVSLPRGTFLSHGGFDEEFPHAAWEDVEFAYRATRGTPALRMVYRPAARTRHHHPTTLPSFRRRQRKAGEAAATFARKHPELAHWLGFEEAARVGAGRRPFRLVLAELAIRLLDPLGVPLPGSTYDRVLRWDYLQGARAPAAPAS